MRSVSLLAKLLGAGLIGGVFAACVGAADVEDPTLNMTGTEEQALKTVNGQPYCNPGKVLICHIPPGNPDNAHSICISPNAVDAHTSHHGDPVGACASEPEPEPEDPGDGDGDGDGDGGGDCGGCGSGSDAPIPLF
ncbi:MAG: hypothetical protein AB7P03_02575 [Kofleriaceae bacterium]